MIKRITPETLVQVTPEPRYYMAHCEDCSWDAVLHVKYPESLEEISGRHVRRTGHSVVIEEEK